MIKLPAIKGIIDRRVLINYKVDLDALGHFLPAPFEPLDINGYGMAGICLIRLKNVRPIGFPAFMGIGSENGAHRIAVRWKVDGVYQEGVYIPRRDTSSRLNAWAGGAIFPGEHHLSKFKTREVDDSYEIEFKNKDGTSLAISAKETLDFPENSIFNNLEEASAFFKSGSLGYSPNKNNCFDGLELNTYTWAVKPLTVSAVQSSFFENLDIFPKDSVIFDNALLMKNIEHEWNMKKPIKTTI
jgi:hypothetical protein